MGPATPFVEKWLHHQFEATWLTEVVRIQVQPNKV